MLGQIESPLEFMTTWALYLATESLWIQLVKDLTMESHPGFRAGPKANDWCLRLVSTGNGRGGFETRMQRTRPVRKEID